MIRIDEKQEAIAFIRMTIDNARKASEHNVNSSDLDPNCDPDNAEFQEPDAEDGSATERTWKFGSPENRKKTTSRILEDNMAPLDPDYKSFDQRLRAFIADSLPEDALRYEDEIYASTFHYDSTSV